MDSGPQVIPRIGRASLDRHILLLDFRADDTQRHATASVAPLSGCHFLPAATQLPVGVLAPATESARHTAETHPAPVEVHGYQNWQTLLNASLVTLTPSQAGVGAAIDILREAGLILYRSDSGERISAPLLFEPADVAIAHGYTFDDLLAQVFRVDMERSVELEGPLSGNWSDYLAELLADSL